ncbi:MAG: hypothetical protein J6T74_05960 [Clostridia bacterium]|nr:hypothetical protein [Clostridia bacterium]MBO7715915.1 hypothetical protein [Methanobrevibacter sp.]
MFELTEENINLLESLHVPNTYWKNKTLEYNYWFRSLLHKIDSSIIFKGLPVGWNEDFFHFCLWCLGYVAVFKTERKDLLKFGENGIVFQPCTVSGRNFYYQPVKCSIANPYYEGVLTIGKQCEVLKLTPDCFVRRGCLDIIDYYATKLAELSKSIDMGIINAKIPMILSAKNEAQANTLKKIYDKVQAGETLVIYKNLESDDGEVIPSKDPFETWNQDFKQTYIVGQMLDDMQKILDSFYTEIGLPVAIEKKERLVTSEADFASAQSQARLSCWVETLKESLEIINKHFNTSIEVEYARTNDTNRDGERIKQDE